MPIEKTMRYLWLPFLFLLVSCTQVDIDQAVPAAERLSPPEEPQVETPIPQAPAEAPEEDFIEIRAEGIFPKEKKVELDEEVTWINKDLKEHKLACYLAGNRVAASSNLKQDDSFSFTFQKEGAYTCIDAIYGLRSAIEVGEEGYTPTGGAVISDENAGSGLPLASIAIVSIIVLLFFVYGRKR